MKPTISTLLLSALPFLGTVYAKTDIGGCISSATTNQWHEASMIWYVEDTGEICDIPDCGGGRAPPKYDNPACPAYTGTATYEPSYLPGYGPGATPTTTAVTKTESATASATETTTATASGSSTITSAPVIGTSTLETSVRVTSSPAVSPSASTSSTSTSSASTTSASGPANPGFTGGAGTLRYNAGVGAAALLAALVL